MLFKKTYYYCYYISILDSIFALELKTTQPKYVFVMFTKRKLGTESLGKFKYVAHKLQYFFTTLQTF